MVKEEVLEFEGTVIECLPNATFKVQLENEIVIFATLSGKMRKNNIRVLLGDVVTLVVSPYDVTRGRITYRFK